jgi:hypothetical protein
MRTQAFFSRRGFCDATFNTLTISSTFTTLAVLANTKGIPRIAYTPTHAQFLAPSPV